MPTVSPELRARAMELLNEGLTYTEIAQRIGRTKNAVAGIIYTARNPGPKPDKRDRRKDLKGRAPNVRPSEAGVGKIAQMVVPKFGVSTTGRDIMLYVVAVSLGYGQTVAAEVLQVSRRLVYEACLRIEDRRDRAGFDASLSEIEEALDAMKNTPGY